MIVAFCECKCTNNSCTLSMHGVRAAAAGPLAQALCWIAHVPAAIRSACQNLLVYARALPAEPG